MDPRGTRWLGKELGRPISRGRNKEGSEKNDWRRALQKRDSPVAAGVKR